MNATPRIEQLGSLEVVVLDALPPLCRPRVTDRGLLIERWLVLAYPVDIRRAHAAALHPPMSSDHAWTISGVRTVSIYARGLDTRRAAGGRR